MINKTSPKGANPHFPAKSSPGVKVAADGGHNLGTLKGCNSKRAASNVRQYH